jgi:hypothetical protein
MYAQLIEARLEPARLAVLERLVRFELVPALFQVPGVTPMSPEPVPKTCPQTVV